MNELDIAHLRCPTCLNTKLIISESNKKHIQCTQCYSTYELLSPNSLNLISTKNTISSKKQEIQAFWGDLYQQWYSNLDKELNKDVLKQNLIDMEDLFYKRKLLPVTELRPEKIKNQNFLEIGCGGGGHSSYFKKMGANITSVDLTPERVISTAKKFSLIEPTDKGLVCVADAENLPFKNDSFDIVYSNGVLHHSENTGKCFEEVYRVLKPSGTAVIMLYSRHSAQFWGNLFIKAIVTGEMFRFREPEWLGRLSEGKPKFGTTKNPLTRVYSAEEIKQTLKNFEIISMRKNGFLFSQLPLIAPFRTYIMHKILKKPFSEGGTILYGAPFIPESKLETFLAPYIGWSWNIVARKIKD